MQNSQDYHVNTQFRMGAATPPLQFKEISNNNNNNNVNVPMATVAPTTSRMMRNQQAASQNVTPQPLMSPVSINNDNSNNNDNNNNTNIANSKNIPNNTNTTANTTTNNNTNNTNNNTNHHTLKQPHDLKQFHRKSLGDWDFVETVGAGSMGKVKLARHHQTNEICAIKIVNRATKTFLHKEQSLPPPKNEQEVLQRQKRLEKEISRDKRTIREASLGQVLYHPHICRLFEMCTMSNHFYMLFEYVSGGQLLDYIIQHGSLREHHARKFARGIASALEYLHGNNIVHRDLKIENIMIATTGEIKIIDFGLSNVYDNKKQLHTFCGSLYFAAPELLKAHPYTGPEVDVWSFGVVLYVLVCGKVPFDDEVSSVLHEKIKQGKVEYPNHLSIEVISLLSKMLVVEPSRRASLKQVIDHPWMNRGYDSVTKSYLTQRIPLTPEMLDPKVIKEMFRLEFIDNIEDTKIILAKIVTEKEYVELSRQYWEIVSYLKRNNPNNGNLTIDDPTRSYNPLLSIYYLVSEMLERKLAKLRRKKAQVAQLAKLQEQQQQQQQQNSYQYMQQQQQQQQPRPQHPQVQPIISEKTSLQQPVQVQQTDQLNSNNMIASFNSQNESRKSSNSTQPIDNTKASSQMPNINSSINSPMKTTLSPSGHGPTLQSPVKRQPPNYNNIGKHKPLQILVPPKLSMPEQAHTSPTSRKSSDNHESFDNVLSPQPGNFATTQHQQQPLSPVESPKPFGGILRKLSQRRQQAPSPTLQSQAPLRLQQPQIKIHASDTAQNDDINNGMMGGTVINNTLNANTIPTSRTIKTHSRTVSEYVPATTQRMPSYGDHSNVITPPMRSASQKQSKKADLPALPSNAASLLQQQREKQVENDISKLNVEEPQAFPGANEDEEEANTSTEDNSPLPPLTVIKGRKFHPSARAKSVGHARRESLKYTRPAVPSNTNYPQDVEDTGFLEYSDDNKSDSTRITAGTNTSTHNNMIKTTQHSSLVAKSSAMATIVKDMTDEQILAEAANAPLGSMPSIDYPRSLFLKGFFSVQTTSSKPLPIVRYNIISVLKKMNIDFKEVKGGFICIQKNPNHIETAIENNQVTKENIPVNNLRIPSAPSEHRRRISGTGSIRRQASLKQAFPGIPNSPLPTSHHERNVSLIASPISDQPNYNNVSQELSTTSIEDFASPDDVLTTSRIQDMNKDGTFNEPTDTDSKQKPPIKFEIHIVKVRIVGLAGVHFKKVSGNTWLYKELATSILKDLNL